MESLSISERFITELGKFPEEGQRLLIVCRSCVCECVCVCGGGGGGGGDGGEGVVAR